MYHNKIINKLYNNGYEVYIVGGAVRDLFSNCIPKDYDLSTNADHNQIRELFPDDKTNTVGNSFLVSIINGIEVSQYRKDIYYGYSDKNCNIIPADTIQEDLSRRDLTINAMAYNPVNEELIDTYNGISDLSNRIIRFVNNPENRIKEDPCRILRACRFAAKIDGTIEKNSLNAMIENKELFQYIAKERIRLEILKCMEYKNASIFFNYLHIIGILENIFPELERCIYFEHGKYHREDVYTHNMLCGDSISTKYPLLKLAGYLHDIGKPASFNGGTFYNHEKYGSEIVKENLKEIRFSNDEIEYISKMIQFHMRDIRNKKSIRKLLLEVEFKDFLRLKIADKKSNLLSEDYSISEIKDLIDNFRSLNKTKFSIKGLEVNGHDVMNILNILPGPKVGKILKSLFEIVLENPELNERDYLINLIQKEN